MNKLAIGTAQFGMDYGIGSSPGKVSINEVKKILEYAKSINIDMLDTASAYGKSEKTLGELNVDEFKIVTKTRHFNVLKITDDDVNVLNRDFDNSLKDLKLDSLYGLLIHNADDLMKPGASKIIEFIQNLKKTKKIKKIGVSIYENKHLNFALENFDIDLVQLPLNIFDRRLIDNGMLKLLSQKGLEVHARSIFLQGLILMENSSRPRKFDRWDSLWKSWSEWLNDYKISPLEASVRYAISFSEISKVLVGIDSVNQLIEIVDAASGVLPPIPNELYTDDSLLLNPSNWNLI
ncbi:aldo/keto reductase [Gammaproteobacteria bacterium]|jgi:aryl-alcohol dehydrogenase-like predicted oxidoreductase|nr:aldo/keto reductase [Gammaproteobacteria bacterium]MDC0387284.1 aldo/keto reductase [Gammaproteobacteria bacterium]